MLKGNREETLAKRTERGEEKTEEEEEENALKPQYVVAICVWASHNIEFEANKKRMCTEHKKHI